MKDEVENVTPETEVMRSARVKSLWLYSGVTEWTEYGYQLQGALEPYNRDISFGLLSSYSGN